MSGYSVFVTGLGELLAGVPLTDATSAQPFDDPDANAILPNIIADAEGLMYRDPDLDFLNTRGTDTTQTTVSGTRTLAIPSSFLTIEQAILFTPAGSTKANGVRVNLARTTPEFINEVFPDPAYTAAPVYGQTYYAMFNASEILIGPTPNGAFLCEYYGVQQQTPLSSTNTDTILTNFYPDLFLAASMIFASAYQRNFGAQADTPQMPVSWQQHYAQLKQGAAFMSARQRFLSAGATAYPPAPQAAGTR